MAGTAVKPGWRLFWIMFGVGWALFAFLVATNGRLVTDLSPLGIVDHQVAGKAAMVDAIQAAWAQAGQLGFARLSMGVDLVFIGILTLAGVLGGLAVMRARSGVVLRALGGLAALTFLVFGVCDYAETISQFVQANSRGDDALAGLAVAVNFPKVAAFLAGHAVLAAALVGVVLTRPRG